MLQELNPDQLTGTHISTTYHIKVFQQDVRKPAMQSLVYILVVFLGSVLQHSWLGLGHVLVC